MKASNLKILLSQCFSTFLLSHKLKLCWYMDQFWKIYVIGIKINKKPSPFFYSNPSIYYISQRFPTTLFITTPRLFRNKEYPSTIILAYVIINFCQFHSCTFILYCTNIIFIHYLSPARLFKPVLSLGTWE